MTWLKLLALIALPIIVIATIILFIKGMGSGKQALPVLSSPLPVSVTSQPVVSFKVVATSPSNQQTDIYPGEIEISFTTDRPLQSAKDFNLTIQPALPFSWQFINSYPTQTITTKVLGRLDKNTTYTLTVSNSKGDQVYAWSFTTSNQQNEASSALFAQYEKQQADQYYPLSDYTPFENNDFSIGYKSRLNLNVYIKNPDVERVKQEVIDWIKSHNVDPSTHTINYINRF